MITDPLLWIYAALGALMVGISKAGITGLSLLSVALFTHVFPSSKQASGLVLPLLIFGDIIAVLSYRAHAQWSYLSKLLPWTAAGIVLGYFTLGRISDQAARIMIGVIIVSLCVWVIGAGTAALEPSKPPEPGTGHSGRPWALPPASSPWSRTPPGP